MFTTHRNAFLDQMNDGDIALFPGASFKTRNHDVDYPFRQDSDYWYLTGHREAEGVLLLAKNVADCPPSTLFVLPKDPLKETWEGVRLGPEGACEELGMDAAFPLAEMESAIAGVMERAQRVWYRLGDHSKLDALVGGQFREMRRKARHGIHPPMALMEPTHVLHQMRLIKSEEEMAWMRRSAAVSCEGHMLAMAQTKDGVGEWEVQALLDYTFRRNGGEGWAYPAIVAGGANACILHYNTNHMPVQDGDLLLIDAGAEFNGYAADITRTFPVNGTFTSPQRDVYSAVLAAQEASIAECRPGNPFHKIHEASVRSLSGALRELGVLKESVDTIVEEGLYREWYLHNTSHWLGLDVHDAGRYRHGDDWVELEAGMCLTVEPGLYFAPDDDRVPAELRGIGVRIEDDIHITGGGCENLTAAAPKTIEEVEAACQSERLAPPVLDTPLAN